MCNILFLVFVLLSLLSPNSHSENRLQAARSTDVSGRWIVTADFNGTPIYFSLELSQQGDKLTGNVDGDKLTGTVSGNSVHFVSKDEQGGTAECTATLQGETLSGSFVYTDPDNAAHPETHQFTATRVPERHSTTPQHHEFTPTTFYRQFSASIKPVMTISPGDSVHTTLSMRAARMKRA